MCKLKMIEFLIFEQFTNAFFYLPIHILSLLRSVDKASTDTS